MVFETIMPVAGFAKETTPEQNNMVKVGTIDIKSYPQLDAKIAQEANRRKKIESKLYGRKMQGGTQLFSSPYFPNQDPNDKQKPLIFANVNAIFTTKGLDGGNFDWEGVFGKDADGKLNKAQIVFEQMDNDTSTRTGVKFFLKVDKDGKYTWSDSEGKPTKLPLYSTDLKPYRYEVLLDEDVTDHVKLLTARFFGTEGGYSFGKPDPATGEIVGNINLDLSIQQIASTKFTSKWNTGVDESDRPTVEGSYLTGYEADPENYGIFKFPSNDTDKTIIRNDQLDPQNPGEYSEYIASQLDKTPTVGVADPDPDATDTYTLDRDNSRISYKGKNYKYDLQYDVINGGKLTMTEVIPVTFDANGGKFASITDPNAEQKIVKEVEYDGTLTDKPSSPTKDRETFKGWSTTADGKTPATDADFANIKEAKTFYAIWDNNKITANELTVHESFKADGATKYTNDFIPTLDQLKEQVKIKDANGEPKALADGDTFAIVDGTNEYTADGDALKNYLYEKLKEKDDVNKPSRTETVKAKITHANGTSQTVDIPIKVIKNIYEAKTLAEKPFYVPAGYVKVTLDPTTKATDPQKTVYYANPAAKVVIPGSNPTGKDDYKFIKWTIPGTPNPIEYKLADRHQFSGETTITAQYSKDVIPQEGNTKPEGVPDNFVKVTFVPTDKGTMEGAKIFWVNPAVEVTIPVNNPLGKTYYTFKEWKMGANADGAVYNPSTPTKFTDTNGTTITATYDEAKNIIPYDPSVPDPMPRPEGYVRVTFAADPGLKLTEQKAYYVKANAKDAQGNAITLGNAELVKPGYEAQTGYKFDKWDKPDTTEIGVTDIVVTAKATKLDNVIPEKKEDGTPNEKPEGYKEVTFVVKAGDESKGSITGIAKFYVNPTEYVKINPPATKDETGYKFGSWDKDATIPTVYDKDTTITGSFNGLKDVIPKTKTDDSEKPKGYVTVTFELEKLDGKEAGKIVDGETITYFVKPNTDVTVPQPKVLANTGYEFDKWKIEDQEFPTEAKKYTADTIVKGSFKKLDDIVDGSKPKPEGYVTLTFDKGTNGKSITGQTVYYVNPKADPAVKLGNNKITKPNITAETGYKFNGWDTKDDFEIKDNKTVIAQYTSIEDVIPKTKEDESEKPDGYITVTFVKGDHGKELTGQAVYYVNPNKAVVLKDKAPTAVPNTGYEFARWDVSIDQAIQYKDGAKITALYNDPGNISTTEVEGYVKVEFKPGASGSLDGTTEYWIKPGVKVNIPAPTVKPNVGYKFDKWDKDLTVTLNAGAPTYEITAGYKPLDDIIPQEKTDGSDKPDGYHTVTFKAVNGTLSGQTVFYVKPNVDIDLTNTANNITKNPNVGYTKDGGTWDKALKATFTKDETYTFTFKALADVIEKIDENTKKPDGYVTVIVKPTDKAIDSTEKTYFVNPNKQVTIPFAKPTGKDVAVDESNPKAFKWIFTKWTSDEAPTRVWETGVDTGITAKFTNETTTITAQYEKSIADQGSVIADEITVHESFKDGDTWVNNFIDTEATEAILKGALKVNGRSLPSDATVVFLDDADKAYADDAAFRAALYDKLKEKDDGNNPSRIEKVRAKVTFKNGETQILNIPIKVIKNIYEAKTLAEKPFYVPAGYVKVTLDPTTKATDPQRTYYYVNPEAKVVIPGENPTGTDGNVFTKWLIKGTTEEYKLADKPRYMFTGDKTIEAQYSKDVIPAKPDGNKAEGTPDNFVKVTFLPTEKGTLEGNSIFYVNPEKEVTIPVNNPVGKTYYTFKEWKIGDVTTGETYTVGTAKKFETATTITATYDEAKNIIPYNPEEPITRPEGYVRVTFAADPGLKLTESKAYYVKANAGITLGNSELAKPAYKEETGYKFEKWDKEDTLQIGTVDIVVTAKVTKLDNVIPEKDGEGNPNAKPEGYKEVTFVIKTGDESKGSITGVAKFYVNPTEYVKINPPTTKANTGYEFGTWDKDSKIPTVYDKDTKITGSFNGLKDIIPKTNPDGTENKQPDGYKTVTFVIDPTTGGKIADGEVKVYYVNPAKEVTVPQPKTAADTGYEFEKWDKDTATAKKYDKDTTVKGNFKKLDDIIPSTDDEGNKNAKPEGYVTVTFEKGNHGELEGKTIYYVNPEADPVKTLANITKPEVKPETGYKFKSWNFADTKAIQSNITVIAQYTPIDDVIPKTNPQGGENTQPDGYITVTFDKGANGELEGNTIFYVNPNKAVVLEGKAPTIKPNTGYTSAGWDTTINKAIQYKDGDKITALYNKLGDVIPQEKTDGSDKPAGYLTVTFDKGDHGELSGKTVYYVKPNKEVTVPAPTVTPATGYEFKDWDKALTQTFAKDTTITAGYKELNNIIPQKNTDGSDKPNGYYTVTFKPDANGTLSGTLVYYVKPNVDIDLTDTANNITKKANTGYKADGGTWNPTITSKQYTEDETYTFNFVKLDDVIPKDNPQGGENTKPDGYVKVEFRSDKNGSLEGNTIFYVNPSAGKTMKDITPLPTIKANKGYKVGNPNWHADFTNDTSEIKEDRIYVANYEALGEAKITYIPRDPEMGSVSPGSEELSEDQEIKGSTATANPGYKFVKWTDATGNQVSTDAKFVPSEKQSATYIAVFKAKDPVTFTVNKVWADDVNPVPTMNFTLYRKVAGGQDEAVPGADVKEITKTNTEATWTNLPKEDSQGKPYTYSVKETFKDQNDVKNDNWILGTMEDDGNGNKTITNKLKTVPGTGDTPNENQHRMGKLTITKKIESDVIQPQRVMRGSGFRKAPAAPLAFTFKVTDPYGNVVKVDGQDTFTLKAGESKELNNLLYGDYTVEETDAKGLTPFVKVGDGAETESKTGKVTLTKDAKEGTVTFTNKNINSLTNPNVIEVKASKVWENGPSTDHAAVTLKLYRQVGNEAKVEVTGVTPEVTRVVSGDPTFNYVWKNLPKINDEGKEYTYTVEEANTTTAPIANGTAMETTVTVNGNTYVVTQEGNTITNTYVVPKTDDLTATKQWVGVPAGTITPEVKFQLQRTANGVTEDIGQAMDLTNDKVNFGKQDKTDVNGNVYVYSVKELDENGAAFNDANYTSEVNGLTVTNTYHAPEVKYTVTYKAGSSTARGTMAADTDARGTYTVKANGFTNDGYTFKGWKVGDTTQIIQPGTTINVTGDVTLTAQWEKTTTPPTPDPDKPNPDKPNPWDPKPWNPNYPDLPYIPRYPEIRYETIVQEKIVKVPVPIADNAYVKEVRYMQGFMGDFRPKDGLTRAEAAQILANALVEDGYKYNPDFKLPYKDIGEAWYTRAVKIVTEARVFAGYDDGNFKPQDKITRNEWIATLKRFQELGDVSGNHMKLKDGHWAMAEIEAAYKEGWLKIYSDGLATYEGDKFIPREEVAAVSNKAFNRVLDKTYIENNDKNLISYKDVKKDMWSYEDILCASNTFLYKKDLYRAHWIKEDNNQFNINTDGFEIVKAKFQRNPR